MEKIVVGLSGGVDSSVTTYLLKEAGYDVYTVTLQIAEDITGELEGAKNVAKRLGVPHKILNLSCDFENIVIKDFLDGYNKGETPSPCVICDEKIKMKTLIDYADSIGAKYIATGHYCSVEYSEELNHYFLKNAVDVRKDQTYMLYRLGEDVIKRLKFPLANLEKTKVREIAEKIGVGTHDKKDSQGICFAPNGYKEYLTKRLNEEIKPGNFIGEDGTIMGRHKGYQFYTVGQRRGLELKLPRPYFVLEIKPETNEIVIGDYDKLYEKKVELRNFKSILKLEKLEELELMARPRFSSKGFFGRIERSEGKDGKKIHFIYNEKNPQNAKGQHLALYYKNYLVGGGKIS